MYAMSLASYKKFLQGPFECILLTDGVENNYEYTFETWRFLKDLWHSEPCNILWVGADTLMIQRTEIFGGFKEYRLFNYTDPRSFREFAHHYNDDVQYYPASMASAVWQLGEYYWDHTVADAELKNWGFDQLRHNAMFWSQNITDDDRLHPKLNYMCHNLRTVTQDELRYVQQWNANLELGLAHILHFCASRGSEDVIHIMRDMCAKLEINYE